MPVVLRWNGQAGGVINAVLIKKDPPYGMTFRQGGPGKLVGGIRRLVLIGSCIDQKGKFHGFGEIDKRGLHRIKLYHHMESVS